MKVLILGNGGREHALAWKLQQSTSITALYSWPGNPVWSAIAPPLYGKGCPPLQEASTLISDHDAIVAQAIKLDIDYIIVGPELPLEAGFVDIATKSGIPTFGPTAYAAQLESSKMFAKDLMKQAQVPTANYRLASSQVEASQIAHDLFADKGGAVLKASGLAAGKGVFVCNSPEEIDHACQQLFQGSLARAAHQVVIEEVLEGRECSFFVLVSPSQTTPLGFAVDYKRRNNQDQGPNTGGMGCYTPVPWLPDNATVQVMDRIVSPTLRELKNRGHDYCGFLYVGLMWAKDGPYVVEFNVRLGDPEAQVLAVQDSRDWGAMIEQHLGLRPFIGVEAGDDRAKTVGVVMTSSEYPYGSTPSPRQDLTPSIFVAGPHDTVFAAAVDHDDSGWFAGQGRVLTVVSRRQSFHEARTCVYSRVKAVNREFNLCHFRNDIAETVAHQEQHK